MSVIEAEEINAFIYSRSATPEEKEIYLAMIRISEKTGFPIKNSEIAEKTKRFRTTVTHHFNNMIEKGLITKVAYRLYVPVYPPHVARKKPAPPKVLRPVTKNKGRAGRSR